MARFKTFNSTGIAPDGRLYAGDLNAIQDFLAKQEDFTQTIDLGTLRIGETGLQLTRFGVGEARITGILRTDGLVRAGGGILAGTFTTAQRNAIPAGQRPPGLTIYNSQVNRYETNFGTDASPVWGLAGEPIAGVMWPWPYAEAGVPAGWALCYGQLVPKATNPQLDALASAAGYPHGSDASNIRLPDMRGRIPVGKDNMGGAAASRVGTGSQGQTLGGFHGKEDHKILAAEMPAHAHPGSGVLDAGNFGGWTDSQGAHAHTVYLSYDYVSRVDASAGANNRVTGVTPSWIRGQDEQGPTSTDGSHSHNVGVNNHGHGLTIAPQGSDTFHNNLQPGLILNWIIKLG